MSEEIIEWRKFDDERLGNWPEWAKSFGLKADGTVLIPADVGGAERDVQLCCMSDSIPWAELNGHIYVSGTWLAKTFPQEAEICEIFVEMAREK